MSFSIVDEEGPMDMPLSNETTWNLLTMLAATIRASNDRESPKPLNPKQLDALIGYASYRMLEGLVRYGYTHKDDPNWDGGSEVAAEYIDAINIEVLDMHRYEGELEAADINPAHERIGFALQALKSLLREWEETAGDNG